MSEDLDSDEIYCPKCGEIIDEDAETCPECGEETKVSDEDNSQIISQRAGNFISWFFGGLVLIVAIVDLFDNPITSIVLIFTGGFAIPPFRRFLEKKIDYKFSRGLVILIFFIGIALMTALAPADNLNNQSLNNQSQPADNRTESANPSEDNLSGTTSDSENPDSDNTSEEGSVSPTKGASLQSPESSQIDEDIKEEVKNSGGWVSWIKNIENVTVEQNLTENYNISSDAVNSTDRLVNVNITISSTGFADDYLAMSDASSEVFRNTFNTHSSVVLVNSNVYKRTKDKYGNYEQVYLGNALMHAATNNKINWEGFESQNLKDVATVNFYGESSYLELKQSQKRLENLQESMDEYSYGSYEY